MTDYRKVYPVISLFSGGGGLDLGLEAAGFETRVCVEIMEAACATLRLNRPNWPVIEGDIRQVSTTEILEAAGLKPGEAALVVGGPPCQGFSNAGKRDVDDPRNQLFWEFVRVVDETRPWGFIMENVRGILTMKCDDGTLVIHAIENAFKSIGYSIEKKLFNTADYGVPQKRPRVIFMGRRDAGRIGFPEQTHWENPQPMMVLKGGQLVQDQAPKRWVSIREALRGLPLPVNSRVANHDVAPPPNPSFGSGSWAHKHRPMDLDAPADTVLACQQSGKANLVIANHEEAPPPAPSVMTNTAWMEKHPPMSLDEPATTILAHQRSGSQNLIANHEIELYDGGQRDAILAGHHGQGMLLLDPDQPSRTLGTGYNTDLILTNHENHPLTPGEVRHMLNESGRNAGTKGIHAWDEPANTITAHREQAILNHEEPPLPPPGAEGHLESRGVRPMDENQPATTILAHQRSGHDNLVRANYGLRRLTVRECARLQTFPDDWVLVGSREAQYTQVGNAVPCLFAQRLGETARRAMEKAGYICCMPTRRARRLRRTRTVAEVLEGCEPGPVSKKKLTSKTPRLSPGLVAPDIDCAEEVSIPAHPTEERRLGVREVARLTTFPDDWQFKGRQAEQYQLASEGVPPLFAQALGAFVLDAIQEEET